MDANVRHRLIRNVGEESPITGIHGGSLLRLDEAIVKGMRALGLRRGGGRGVLRGRKTPDCHIHINTLFIEQMLAPRGAPDGIFKTWIHESLHARRPYATEEVRAAEYPDYQGYEEGLVEGLARWIVRDKAGMAYLEAYPFYVWAYETLAAVLEMDVLDLWRNLWRYPFGEIRGAFPGEVYQLWYNRTGHRISEAKLRGLADRFFASRQRPHTISDEDMRAMWREALDDEG